MNGFLIVLGSGAEGKRSVRAPYLEASQFAEQHFDPDLRVLLWGQSGGDVTVHAAGEWVVVFNGYVAESSRLTASPAESVCALLADAEDVTRCLSGIADSIHGSFSIVAIRPSAREMYTVSDPISSRAVWVKNSENRIVASSHAVAIAQVSGLADWDPVGLGSMLLYGGPVDPTRCIYAGVTTAREGEVSLHRSGAERKPHIYYRFRHRPEARTTEEWLELAAEHLRTSARRILNTCERPLLYLSGGVDSRLAAAALRSVGGRPLLVTLADHHNMETRVARKVAKALECEHLLVMRDPHWYLRAIPRAVFDSNGVYLFHQAHFADSFLQCQQTHQVDAALLGDFCEAFSKTLPSPFDGPREAWSTDAFVSFMQAQTYLPPYKPVDRAATLELLAPDVRLAAEQQLSEAIATRYVEVAQTSADPKIVADQFVRWQSAHCIGTYGMLLDLRSVGAERNLMFDKDLQALLETMPSSIRNGANLGKRLIHRIHRGAGRVVDANSYLPLSFPPAAHSAAKRMRPLAGKLRRRLIENSHRTTSSWPHLPKLYSRDATWQAEITRLLSRPELLPPNIFERAAIQACWQAIQAGDLRRTPDLEKLIHLAKLRELES